MKNYFNNTKNATDVIAIVVTYNRCKLLEKCIQSIKRQKYKCSIIVIDNASADDTEALCSMDNEIEYIRIDSNIGLSNGICYGLKKAYKNGYKYFWILDDDMEPDDDALYHLINSANKINEWSCLSSYVYWKDGSICKANRQKKGVFTFVRDEEYENKSLIPVKMVSWGSMFLNASAVFDAGLPISDFFIYTDDYEFSYRLYKEKPIYVVTQSKVKHNMDKNEKANVVKATPERVERFRYLYRNDVYFYRQFGIKGWSYIIMKDLVNLVMVILRANNKLQKISMIINGIKVGIDFKPDIEYIVD